MKHYYFDNCVKSDSHNVSLINVPELLGVGYQHDRLQKLFICSRSRHLRPRKYCIKRINWLVYREAFVKSVKVFTFSQPLF